MTIQEVLPRTKIFPSHSLSGLSTSLIYFEGKSQACLKYCLNANHTGYFYRFLFPSNSLGSFAVDIRLSNRGNGLHVQLRNASQLDSTSIDEHMSVVTLASSRWAGIIEEGDEPPNRIIWPLSNGEHMLVVAIRPQMIDGNLTQVVKLDVHEKVQCP